MVPIQCRDLTITNGDGNTPHSAFTWNKYLILVGYIGNTGCCGSAEIWGGYPSAGLITQILKETKASIIYAHWEFNMWELDAKVLMCRVEKEVGVPGVFSIEISKPSSTEMWIHVKIEDPATYHEWLYTK